jgi:hypothetical protein
MGLTRCTGHYRRGAAVAVPHRRTHRGAGSFSVAVMHVARAAPCMTDLPSRAE